MRIVMGDSGHEHTQARSRDDVSRQTPRPQFAAGTPLPNLEMWTLERRLGGGGFGEVWLVRHDRKGVAAVKFCTDPGAQHQLVHHERAVIARVMKHGGDHPNIVPLLECNLSGDIPWLMYEFVEGGTLAEAAGAWAALPAPRRLGRAVRVLYAITGALAKFHRLKPPLVHRDLKPQNVLMAGSVPRITDFGIGGMAVEAGRDKQLESSGSGLNVRVPSMLQSVGSSRYAPQEQFLGSAPNPRDDVYAIGVLAFQMMLGDLTAAPGPDALSGLRALKIPAELAALTVQSVALDPAQRPRDAGAWEEVLASLLNKKTVAPPAPRPSEGSRDDDTETMDALGASASDSVALVTQVLDVVPRGRWYSRPAAPAGGEWKLIAATPGEVRVIPGELYRFSINSAATKDDVDALGALAGLESLVYLNLSFCEGVTDAGLVHLKNFRGLRQLFLRGCPRLTDRGLAHLHSLTSLRTLELTGSPRVTGTAVAELQKALPRCKVLR